VLVSLFVEKCICITYVHTYISAIKRKEAANANATRPRKSQQLISAGIYKQYMGVRNRVGIGMSYCAGIFKQSMGARNQVGIGLSYRHARLHTAWRNWFLGIDSWASSNFKIGALACKAT
jgi:hypothetical protein